jgi:K+-transporting ATPase ATPase C chain
MDMNPTHNDSLDHGGGGVRAYAGFAVLSILAFGLAWPLATAMIGGALFPDAARGSLIERNGVVVGSLLAAQPFADARYVIPRPSAAGYAGMGLAGSNWAPSNPALRERAAADAAAIAAREGVAQAALPPELVTASGSGIDPHLSPAAVAIQLPRIARARGIDVATLEALLARHVEAPQFGVFGQSRVNVLAFNLALDESHPAPVR